MRATIEFDDSIESFEVFEAGLDAELAALRADLIREWERIHNPDA